MSDKIKKNSIIAEIGSVHDGSFGNACKLVELAKKCGADTVKFQTHIAEAETVKDAPMPIYFDGEPRFQYFQRTSFTKEQWIKLKEICDDLKIDFLSSPFSIEAAELLEEIGVEKFKIPSGEVTNLPLIEQLASYSKPILISSGMSNWEELDKAVDILIKKVDLTIMQCTSKYPCPPQSVGLNIFSELRNRYGSKFNLGFSDHTATISAGIAAAALGVKTVEKHLTFSKSMYGSDAKNSLEPDEFLCYSKSIREVWFMLDNPILKNEIDEFKDMKKVFEKSIFTSKALSAGSRITFSDLAFKKPGDGLSASIYKELIGLRVKKDLPVGYKLSWGSFK